MKERREAMHASRQFSPKHDAKDASHIAKSCFDLTFSNNTNGHDA